MVALRPGTNASALRGLTVLRRGESLIYELHDNLRFYDAPRTCVAHPFGRISFDDFCIAAAVSVL